MATEESQQLGWEFQRGDVRRSSGKSPGSSETMSDEDGEPEFDGIIRRSVDVEIRSINEAERSVEFVASTNSIDSHGDVVDQKFDLKRFKKNPVILWHHNKFGGYWSDGVSRPKDFLPIGRGENTKLEKNAAGEKQLCTKVFFGSKEYNELAEQVWLGCKERIIRAVSIGFRPGKVTERKDEHGGTYYELSDNELYEISVVPIPSNPDSVAKSIAFEHKHLRRLAAKQRPGKPEQKDTNMADNDAYEKAVQAKTDAEAKVKSLEAEIITLKKTSDAEISTTKSALQAETEKAKSLEEKLEAQKLKTDSLQESLEKSETDLKSYREAEAISAKSAAEADVQKFLDEKVAPNKHEEKREKWLKIRLRSADEFKELTDDMPQLPHLRTIVKEGPSAATGGEDSLVTDCKTA